MNLHKEKKQLDSIPYVLAKENIVIEVGEQFQKLTGYEKNEIVGKDINYLGHNLLRLNVDIDELQQSQKSFFMFTKKLEPREVDIEVSSLKGENIIIMIEKQDSRLEEKFTYLDQLYNNEVQGIAVYSAQDFTLLRANHTYIKHLEEPFNIKERCIGKRLNEIISNFSASKIEEVWTTVLDTGKPFYCRECMNDSLATGITYWDWSIVPIYERGKIKYIIKNSTEVTERVHIRKQLEEKNKVIEQQKKELDAIFDNMVDGFCVVDKNGNIIKVNKSIKKWLDNKDAKKVKDTFKTVKYSDFYGNEIANEDLPASCIARGEKLENYELLLKTDQHERYFSINGAPIYDENGNFVVGVYNSRDITDKTLYIKRVEEQAEIIHQQYIQLQNQNALLYRQANMLNLSYEASIAWNITGKIVYWNKGAENLYGYTGEEAVGCDIHDILKTVYPSCLEDILVILLKEGEWCGEIEHTTKDSKKLSIETRMQIILNEHGQQVVLETNRDITERKKSEEALIQVNDRLSVAMESVGAGILELDVISSNQIWSPRMFEIYGIDPSESMSLEKGLTTLHPNDRESAERSLIEAYKNQSEFWHHEFRIVNPNRGIVWVSGTAKIIYDKTGNPIKLIGVNIDITHQKKQQQQLLQAEFERNEALENTIKIKDEFLATITHEFKTPLTVINAALQTIESIYGHQVSDSVKKHLQRIKTNSFRQLRLVNNLLDITSYNAGRFKMNKKNVDIVFISKSIVKSVDVYTIQKGLKLQFLSDVEYKEMAIDEEKYERILLNLLSNAIKFTPEGKCIYVKISCNNRKAIISIEDEGMGIPKSKQKLIFERFGQVDSSLSRQAEGTGIGLSLVKTLLEGMNGTISVESEVGKGSKFTITLPAAKLRRNGQEATMIGTQNNRIMQATAIEFSDIYLE